MEAKVWVWVQWIKTPLLKGVIERQTLKLMTQFFVTVFDLAAKKLGGPSPPQENNTPSAGQQQQQQQQPLPHATTAPELRVAGGVAAATTTKNGGNDSNYQRMTLIAAVVLVCILAGLALILWNGASELKMESVALSAKISMLEEENARRGVAVPSVATSDDQQQAELQNTLLGVLSNMSAALLDLQQQLRSVTSPVALN